MIPKSRRLESRLDSNRTPDLPMVASSTLKIPNKSPGGNASSSEETSGHPEGALPSEEATYFKVFRIST